jgi:2-keto-3-deoxy-L-fuconate dehydrogenase
MVRRRAGKVLVIGSASALRGMKRASTYSAARGAQLAYVQAVGVEAAQHQVQINAIAQNFVENPTYFPPEVQANPRFQERLQREVPLGRLVAAREDALFAAYLCSEAANCFVGQVFPLGPALTATRQAAGARARSRMSRSARNSSALNTGHRPRIVAI